MSIAEKIKLLREKERYTQKALAKAIGVQSNTIWRWETGKAVPDTENARKLALTLGTSSSYLLGETDNPEDLHAKVLDIANSSWSDDLQEPISTGYDGKYYIIHDGNTNHTFKLPDNEEGRKIFLDFMNRILNPQKPIVENTISGNNNSGNKLGIINV